jgi:pimeloyl-ACP methyl ester carboxylesterase
VAERTEIDGTEVHWRRLGDAPILYLHGVPTASWQWEPFLELTGGVAPDLPGFGESGKANNFDYSIEGYGRFLDRFVDEIGLDRVSLVVQGWGAVGFQLGERIERLVVLGDVPFEPGYEWPKIGRRWRTPLIGELTMGFTSQRSFRRLVPPPIAERAWQDFDHGTQRAILKLTRSAELASPRRPDVPTLEIAGDWAWIDDPRVVEQVAHFLRQ